jgi:hypothetical protein
MSHEQDARPTNALIHETSPYLLQHARNPVDWFPWGEAALEKAGREDKPIFLSIGYAACHWCHVMERESFENRIIAACLNEHFVSIKVDREERPDLDAIYMQAVQMLSGSGGWPMTVFLTADGRPFFGGTYFPPENRYGRIGFLALLERIREAWATRRESVREQGDTLARAIAEGDRPPVAAGLIGMDLVTGAARDLARRFDARDGGFGGAPKFPPSMALHLLLAEWKRTGETRLRAMAELTLDRMARGGMVDHLGGGFHRYSTDAQWLVPHFEKMLYDNALLARVYLDAALATGHAEYERVARQTLDYVLRDMADAAGGFYSSQDADSEGVEGKYYVWTPEEVAAALGDKDATIFNEYYGVRDGGNWAEGEGASILNVETPLDAFAKARGVAVDGLRARLDAMRQRLLDVRRARVPPLTDDKVLASWNGMMISAFARGAQATGEGRYLDAATRASDFILSAMRDEHGWLLHTWRGGAARIPGFLEDYAHVAAALIDLYETTFQTRWLREADRLAGMMIERFGDAEHGGFYSTDGRDASLIARGKEFYDGATPSGNSAAVGALLRLARLLDRPAYENAARATLRLMAEPMRQMPGAYHEMIRAAAFEMVGAVDVAIAVPPDSPETRAILAALWREYLPYRVLALSNPAAPADTDCEIALLKDRPMIDGKPTIHVCRNGVCRLPVHTAAAMLEELK